MPTFFANSWISAPLAWRTILSRSRPPPRGPFRSSAETREATSSKYVQLARRRAILSVNRWVDPYRSYQAVDEFGVYYYTARLGIEQGWNQIYNHDALRALMAKHFTGQLALIDGGHTFPNPPPLAWMIAPLTVLPFGPAYAIWSLLGVASVVVAWAIAAPFSGLGRV